MGRIVSLCLAVGLVAAVPGMGLAQNATIDLTKAAEEAQKLATGGKYIEAIDALDSAAAALWEAAPLSYRKAVLVASQPGGFGVYEQRNGAAFKRDEQILIYAEPVGYGYGKDGNLNAIELVGDVEVKTEDGKVLGGQKAFARFGLKSRVKNREFYAFITYSFSGLQPGNYVAATTLTDTNTGKSGAFDLPFTIVE